MVAQTFWACYFLERIADILDPKLFNYKYAHIVIPNVLHLNQDFSFLFFLSFLVSVWDFGGFSSFG